MICSRVCWEAVWTTAGKFDGMTGGERNALLDTCFEHNDHLRANGILLADEALQPPETA